MHISAYEACLERVAEELMGRRKWKQYQDTLMRTHLNSDQFVATIEDNNIELKKELDKLEEDIETLDIHKTSTVKNNNNNNNNNNSNLEDNHRKEINQQQQPQQQQQQNNKHHTSIKQEETDNTDIKLESQENNLDTAASQTQGVEISKTSSHNNNNNITNPKPTNTESAETSPSSPPPPEPIDWKPNDKCYFCINGKLLTLNSKGELVAESGPTGSETDHIKRLDCDSDSNESSKLSTVNTNGNAALMTGANSLTGSNRLTLSKLLTQKMTSMDSVAAQFAAIQNMLPNLNWMSQQQQQQTSQTDSVTPTTSDTSAAAISPSLKDSPSPSDATGEQPLDLSSKPSPNSSISGDLKSVRIKSSRATPVPSSRRTYSEEDINNAMHEVLAGRLGTRKAAVQFNVPRSTLRNKMYKLATETKRPGSESATDILQQELEKDMSGDEADDGGVDSNASTPQPEDELRRINTPTMLKKIAAANNGEMAMDVTDDHQRPHLLSSPKPAHTESSKPQTNDILNSNAELSTPPQPQIPQIDTTLLLQTLLLSDKNLRDLFSALLLNSTINLKDVLMGATTAATTAATAVATAAAAAAAASEPNTNSSLNNGNQQQDYRPLLQLLLQQQQQQQQQNSFAPGRARLPKSDTPETNSSLDPNESCDDPTSAILKIPSYTPVAGTSSSMGPSSSRGSPALHCHNSNNSNSNRNGGGGDSPGPLMLAAAVNAAKNQLGANNSLSVTPPLLHGAVDSQTTQSLRMRDVIANSIHRTMSEQANKEAHAASLLGLVAESERNSSSGIDYKKPTISVVKNIGGTDTSRFGTAPNLLANAAVHNHHHQHHHMHAHHLRSQEAAALAAGKGTRPKRGKYRNYDRDSLVEAVKAVQRGEMSVHRAGSYYGVPHSTLEYKVKERHLMRPRKREPKPQAGLDGPSNSSKSNANIPSGLAGLDKLKAGNGTSASMKLSGAKNNGGTGASVFPGNAGNGMKLPLFDPALTHLPYASSMFWQHPQAAFGQLQMEYNRNATAAGSAASPTESGSEILKSHIQRYQEQAAAGGGGNTTNSSNGPSPISSPPILSGHDINRARELYETNAANGANFLDGIIRHTLDRKSNEAGGSSASSGGGGVLLDQLLMKKTPLPFTNNRGGGMGDYNSLSRSPTHLANKRGGSPLSLRASSIKRERTDSGSDEDETSQSGADEYERETNNNNNNNNSSSCSKGGSLKTLLHQRDRRIASRDSASETDASSLKSEQLQMNNNNSHHMHHNNNNGSNTNNNNSMVASDINGGGGGVAINVKSEIPTLESGTSILQEKLSQIKSEQQENEENL